MDRASVNSHGKKPAEELLKLTGDDTRKITSTFKPQFMWEVWHSMQQLRSINDFLGEFYTDPDDGSKTGS